MHNMQNNWNIIPERIIAGLVGKSCPGGFAVIDVFKGFGNLLFIVCLYLEQLWMKGDQPFAHLVCVTALLGLALGNACKTH